MIKRKFKINFNILISASMLFCRCDCNKKFNNLKTSKPQLQHQNPEPKNEDFTNVKKYKKLYERSLTPEIIDFKDKKAGGKLTQEDVDKMGTEGFIALRIAEGTPNWIVLYKEYKKNPNLKINYINKTDEFINRELSAGIYYVDQLSRAEQVIKIAHHKDAGADIDESKGDLYADCWDSRYVNTPADSDTNFDDIEELLLLMKTVCSFPRDDDFYDDLKSNKNLFMKTFNSESDMEAAECNPGIYFIKSNDTEFEIKKIIKINNYKASGASPTLGDLYWDRDIYKPPGYHWLECL